MSREFNSVDIISSPTQTASAVEECRAVYPGVEVETENLRGQKQCLYRNSD